MNIPVVSDRPWARPIVDKVFDEHEYTAIHIDNEKQLRTIENDIIFVIHWSNIIPSDLLEERTFVGFHMTDLPQGRGGSPLQNLIVRGHKKTVLTAFRMTNLLDGGPIYAKTKLSLEGRAQEIYERATQKAAEMIVTMIPDLPPAVPQTSRPKPWPRRKPDQSQVPIDTNLDPEDLYNHIRMLDAEGYPHAYIEHGPWRIEFTHAAHDDHEIVARARIRRKE